MDDRCETPDGRRVGDWMQLASGKAFFPLDPRPEDIEIEDIAHGLAHVCRYNGHSKRFYSVAEHSVLVSWTCDPADAFEGLMHDAAEAYIGDMIRPLKRALPAYQVIERKIEEVIAQKFGLRFPWPASVKRADDAVLMAERRDIMCAPPMPWRDDHEPAAAWTIVGLSPMAARVYFLDEFARLQAARSVRAA